MFQNMQNVKNGKIHTAFNSDYNLKSEFLKIVTCYNIQNSELWNEFNSKLYTAKKYRQSGKLEHKSIENIQMETQTIEKEKDRDPFIYLLFFKI